MLTYEYDKSELFLFCSFNATHTHKYTAVTFWWEFSPWTEKEERDWYLKNEPHASQNPSICPTTCMVMRKNDASNVITVSIEMDLGMYLTVLLDPLIKIVSYDHFYSLSFISCTSLLLENSCESSRCISIPTLLLLLLLMVLPVRMTLPLLFVLSLILILIS